MINSLKEKLNERNFPLEFPGHWWAKQWHQTPRAKQKISSINPSDGETLISFNSEGSILQQCIDAAETARSQLEEQTALERVEILSRLRQMLSDESSFAIDAMCVEGGKARWEAELDFASAVHLLDQLIQNPEHILKTLTSVCSAGTPFPASFRMTPLGTTLAFVPFSSPITSLVNYMAASIYCGNPLVLVLSHHAVLSGVLAAHLAQQLDLCSGTINVAFCSFEMSKQYLSDKRIKAILYTGSIEHCDTIRKESLRQPGRQLILQCGGKNAVVIDAEADMQKATRICAMGAFKSAGQLCTATSRVFVHQERLDEFKSQMTDFVQKMSIGPTDGSEDNPWMGPLYSKKAVEKFLRFQTMAHRESQEDLFWGKTVEGRGFFVRPGLHLMKSFDPKSAYQSNALLCPDLCVYSYQDVAQLIPWLHDTDAAFSTSYVGSWNDFEALSRSLRIPNMLYQLPTVEIASSLALAGRRQCGQHRYAGMGLLALLSQPQAIMQEKDYDQALSCWPS